MKNGDLFFMAWAGNRSGDYRHAEIEVSSGEENDLIIQMQERLGRNDQDVQYYLERAKLLAGLTGQTKYIWTWRNLRLKWQSDPKHGYDNWYGGGLTVGLDDCDQSIWQRVSKMLKKGVDHSLDRRPRDVVLALLAAGVRPIRYVSEIWNHVVNTEFDLDAVLPEHVEQPKEEAA